MRLCLLAHGLTDTPERPAGAHAELLIPVQTFDALLQELTRRGFDFVLPDDPGQPDRHACSVTFDDGYANNALFLPLADRYRVPFVLFVNSLNIEQQIPFLWDIQAEANATGWRHWADDYRDGYRHADAGIIRRLMADDRHRPFTPTELTRFAASPWTHLALHTHSHQPLVGRHLARLTEDIEENRRFVSQFPRPRLRDLSLPCGLYTWLTLRRVLREGIDRVYTIDGGQASADKPIVHRISLVAPSVGGPLMAQIERWLRWRTRLRRKMANVRYSTRLLAGV